MGAEKSIFRVQSALGLLMGELAFNDLSKEAEAVVVCRLDNIRIAIQEIRDVVQKGIVQDREENSDG